jgi:ABC-type transporter Mla MlaB component
MKTIKLPGDVGIKKARKLYAAAAAMLEGNKDCALDFSRVQRIDLSVGQVVLALGRECARRGGRLEIRNTNEATARLLGLAGVE